MNTNDESAQQPDSATVEPSARRQSAAVTGVAVLNFVCGALFMVCGLGATVFGGAAGASLGRAMSASIRGQVTGALAGIVVGFAILVLGVPFLVAGYGVLKRCQWGRILALVLGGLHGFQALSSAMNEKLGFVFSAAYFLFTFVVLLDRRYRAEFDAAERESVGARPSRLTRRLKRTGGMAPKSKGLFLFLGCAIAILLIVAALLFQALFMRG